MPCSCSYPICCEYIAVSNLTMTSLTKRWQDIALCVGWASSQIMRFILTRFFWDLFCIMVHQDPPKNSLKQSKGILDFLLARAPNNTLHCTLSQKVSMMLFLHHSLVSGFYRYFGGILFRDVRAWSGTQIEPRLDLWVWVENE